jgi:hypothetical protein
MGLADVGAHRRWACNPLFFPSSLADTKFHREDQQGKAMVQFVQPIRNLHTTISIVVIANVDFEIYYII